MARLVFTVLLSLNLVSASAWANGSNYYNGVCEALLQSQSSENIEEYFVSQSTSYESMLKLLTDYKLIFDVDFGKALLGALTNKGFIIEKLSSEKLKVQLLELKRILSLEEPEMKEIIRLVKSSLAQLKARNHLGRSSAQSKVESKRVSRLLAAIEKDEAANLLFEKVMSDYVRSAVVQVALIELGEIRKAYGYDQFSLGGNLIPAAFAMSVFLGSGAHYLTDRAIVSLPIMIGSFLVVVGGSLAVKLKNLKFKEADFSDFSPQSVVMPSLNEKYSNYSIDFFSQHRGEGYDDDFVEIWRGRTKKANGDIIPPTYHQILNDLRAETNSGVLSVEQACRGDICKLNPIEIAYLGHIDVIEIQEQVVGFREALTVEHRIKGIEGLRILAQEALGQPEPNEKRARFKKELEKAIEETNRVEEARTRSLKALLKRIQRVISGIRELKDRAYTSKVDSATDDDLNKYDLYLSSVNVDLGTLYQLEGRVKDMIGSEDRLSAPIAKTSAEDFLKEIERW